MENYKETYTNFLISFLEQTAVKIDELTKERELIKFHYQDDILIRPQLATAYLDLGEQLRAVNKIRDKIFELLNS